MNSIENKSNFFKNPIGVIGIFLVLTEAIASAVIVNSSLNSTQNTILVFFIVLFPCLVLWVFYLLVTKHHEKLYSPSDYKDEKNFVNTYNIATQKDDIRRIVGDNEEQTEIEDKNNVLLKEALVNVMELQKKIIPTVESSVLTEDEKNDYVSSMDDYLLEMNEEDRLFKVDITPMYKSTKLVEELVKRGYIANIYRFGMEDKKVVPNAGNEAIWLGNEVPIDMALGVLKIAKKYYPHLKYIQLSDGRYGAPDYVRYQIYIGGSSNTAREYGLRALSIDDFDELYGVQTQKELHDFVRQFDPYYD